MVLNNNSNDKSDNQGQSQPKREPQVVYEQSNIPEIDIDDTDSIPFWLWKKKNVKCVSLVLYQLDLCKQYAVLNVQ